MTQVPPIQAQPPAESATPKERPPAYRMGIAGFITSIVGSLACCMFGWIGAILCAIAMQKGNKSPLNIAGLVIGIVSTMLLIFNLLLNGPASFQKARDITGVSKARAELVQYIEDNGRPATAVEAASILQNSGVELGLLRYEPTEDGFTLIYAGDDGIIGSPDDLIVTHP